MIGVLVGLYIFLLILFWNFFRNVANQEYFVPYESIEKAEKREDI